jgi:molybdenum cofactor synthesis domain-containing protein
VLVSIEDAQLAVLSACRPLTPVAVPVAQAVGLVLAEPAVAEEAVPPFTNSAMDGYAVRSADVAAAPARLAEVGTLMAGDDPGPLFVGQGQAVRIMTGAPLPAGADAVCMVENTRSEEGSVWVDEPVPAGTNVRRAGSDVAPGQEVLPTGTFVGGAQMSMLASLGAAQVMAHPRPRVGVVSTGDELVSGPGPLAPGKIRDSNRPGLLAQLELDNFSPVDLGHAPDDPDGLARSLQGAVTRCDAIITSGGVSVGDRDVVKMVLQKLGADACIWLQVAVKPAKPFAFAPLPPQGTPVFGLPGNPVSALVSYELFARPALRAMAGHRALSRPRLWVEAGTGLRRAADGKTHLVRARVTAGADGRLVASSAGAQGSHQMAAMAAANALAVLPDGEGVGEGEPVQVMLLDIDSVGPPAPVGPLAMGAR